MNRSNPAAAIESMNEAAHAVAKNNLSLIIFPEGTRVCALGIANTTPYCSNCNVRHSSSMEKGQLARKTDSSNS
ncbi:hypothetical protein HAX54_010027 [Datura stramonium]|uniref:Phospholipid/glycerol acyltransferase domain-containing protein n=1 Tax=Datura stramonium TaxID=4076 RepID=A0ABS8TGM3_DATST|nr:hypothetical protein [Datura stramonium]